MALTDNIKAYYKLDEASGNPADATGNGFTLTNTNTVGFGTGLINNGADFGTANTNKYFIIANSLGFTGNNALTVALWVKIRTEPTGGNFYAFSVLRNVSSNPISLNLQYFDSAGTTNLRATRAGAAFQDVAGPFAVTLGTTVWHQVVMWYDGTDLKLYLDTVERGTIGSIGTGTTNLDSNFSLGANETGAIPASTFMDEVGVWNRALSTGEITQLYNGGAGIQYPFAIAGGTSHNLGLLGVGS